MDALALQTMRMKPETAAEKERHRAEDVAKQFESIFVRTLVSSLRQTSGIGGEGGMFGSGPGSDTYADWFDQNLADKVTSSAKVGIEEQLIRDFEKNGELPKRAASVAKARDEIAKTVFDRNSLHNSLHGALQTGKRGIDVLP